MPVISNGFTNYGLGGALLMENLDGRNWRQKGSLTFGGRLNIIWICTHHTVVETCLDALTSQFPLHVAN